jgi:hypothetical protein
MANKHILQDVQDDIHRVWACTILLGKCCVHMLCSLNDWNDLILQLLQVLLFYYGALHKAQSNKPLLAEHTPNCILQDGVMSP